MDMGNLKTKLESYGYTVKLCETKEQARDFVLSIIEPGATIGTGGSMTISELNLPELLHDKGHTVFYRNFVKDMDPHNVRIGANNADYYLCSSNAITESGTMVNIDGICNRIASMCYGPKHVVYVIGKNKITKDLPSALTRVKEQACPKNAKRLGLSTPCGVTGKCTDCDSTERMCRNTLITERPPRSAKNIIVLVNEDLGY